MESSLNPSGLNTGILKLFLSGFFTVLKKKKKTENIVNAVLWSNHFCQGCAGQWESDKGTVSAMEGCEPNNFSINFLHQLKYSLSWKHSF